MKLVVCDDHRLLLEALGLALTEHGYHVAALVSSPEGAVEAARQHRPDIVLLDVNFPDGTSLAAISRIREACPTTRVVMLSAEADHAVVGRAIAEGASGYVGKEKPIQDIIEKLTQAVNGHVAVDPGLLQQALRTRKASDDPLWALQFLTDRVGGHALHHGGSDDGADGGDPRGAAQHGAHPRAEPPDQARRPLPPAGRRTDGGPRLGGHVARPHALTCCFMPLT